MNRARMTWLIRSVVVATLCCTAAAQVTFPPPWNLRLVADIGGWCRTAQVVDHYAYVVEGGKLTILEISNRSSALAVGHLSLAEFHVFDMGVKEGLAYFSAWRPPADSGLLIVDVTNPRSPRILSFYAMPIGAVGVHVTERTAYVAGNGRYLDPRGWFQIIDVSDPSSPTLRGSFVEMSFPAWKIYASDGIAYVAARDGLHIFDVTNPALPRRLAYYSQSWCNDVIVAGGLAYTATDDGLEVVDVTSPTAPTWGGGRGCGAADGLFLWEGLVFLAQQQHPPDFPNGLAIIDVTDPSSPTLIGTCPTSGWASDVTVSSGTAYLADKMGGLCIVDVTTPSTPMLLGTYDTLSDPTGIYVADGVAYVANGVRGLKTIDVSNPQSPAVLGSLATPVTAQRVFLSGTTAYVCGNSGYTPETWRSLLMVVDVTTASSPRLLGSYAPPEAWDIAVSGGLAYILHNDGFQIVDITNPTSPTLRGSFATPGSPCDIFLSGDLAFIADFTNLQIVDVSDPTSPVLRSSFTPGSSMTNVFVSNGVAYLTGTWTGGDFACLDVSNPDAPRLLGMYDVPSYEYEAGGLSVSNGRAYVLLDGLRVIDVRDPSSPTLCGFYPTGRSTFASDVFACGDLVYLVDITGLRIFEFTGGPTQARHWRLYR